LGLFDNSLGIFIYKLNILRIHGAEVVHSWDDSQRDKVLDFIKQVTEMAKTENLPK
jgi:hypothetical protein